MMNRFSCQALNKGNSIHAPACLVFALFFLSCLVIKKGFHVYIEGVRYHPERICGGCIFIAGFCSPYPRNSVIAGKADEIDHPWPIQSDHLGRLKLTTLGRSKLTTP
jgi:hypothetical protein